MDTPNPADAAKKSWADAESARMTSERMSRLGKRGGRKAWKSADPIEMARVSRENGRKGGRRPAYNISGLLVGEERVIPWRLEPDGRMVPGRHQFVIGQCVARQAHRLGWSIVSRGSPAGLRVTRTA